MKSKKGEIATTLTWVPAVAIIFFIMFLFVAAAAFSTGGKFISGDKNELSFEEEELNYAEQALLVEILNTPVGEERVDDLILKWWLSKDSELREQIQGVVEEVLEDEDFDYVFRVNYGVDGAYEDYFDVRSGEIVFPEESYESNLFVDGEKIKVELYLEK